MFVILLQLLFSFFVSMGALFLGQLLFKKLFLKSDCSAISCFFAGALPLVLLDVVLSGFFYEKSTLSLFLGVVPRVFYFFWGLTFVFRTKKETLRTLYRQHKLYVAVLCGLGFLFLPAFLLPMYVHPSWDSDATAIWLPKFLGVLTHGFLPASANDSHPTYFSFVNRLMGSLFLSLPDSIPETLVASRIFSLLLMLLGFRSITALWPARTSALMVIPLLSGFPIKWINGYQDHWVAFFLVGTLFFYFEELDLELGIFLGLLASSKNEGLAISIIAIPLFFSRLRKITWVAFFGAIGPVIYWKLFIRFRGVGREELAVQWLSLPEASARAGILLKGFVGALQRRVQGSWVDAAISLLLLWLGDFSWNPKFVKAVTLCSAAVLIPQGIVFFTSYDYPWHLDTTITRISSAGLMGFVFLFFYKYNQTQQKARK